MGWTSMQWTPLYSGSLSAVPMVSAIERFHCIQKITKSQIFPKISWIFPAIRILSPKVHRRIKMITTCINMNICLHVKTGDIEIYKYLPSVIIYPILIQLKPDLLRKGSALWNPLVNSKLLYLTSILSNSAQK